MSKQNSFELKTGGCLRKDGDTIEVTGGSGLKKG